MTFITTTGIIIAILLLIYFTVKGLNIIISAPITTLIVIFTNNMPILETMLGKQNSYIYAFSNFIINNFAIFILGSILAQYMEKSGATYTIAKYILEKIGKNSKFKVLLAITIISAILTYGGISIFIVIFAIIPLAKPLFKELDIDWELFPIPLFLGASTFTMTMLPATPSIHNTIPTKVLGTTLTSAPLISILGTIFILIFGIFYMHFQLKKSISLNKGFNEAFCEEKNSKVSKQLPNLILSLSPILLLITIIFTFNKVNNIIVIALTTTLIFCYVIFYKFIKNNIEVINLGTSNSILPTLATSSSVAFGTILTTAIGFEIIKNLITNIPGNPLIGLSFSTAIFSGITGSSSGAIGIAMNTLIPRYLELGINPEILHRITVVASATLTVMPQSGVLIAFNTLTGLSIKRGFKHAFFIVNVGHIIALTAMLIFISIFYN